MMTYIDIANILSPTGFSLSRSTINNGLALNHDDFVWSIKNFARVQKHIDKLLCRKMFGSFQSKDRFENALKRYGEERKAYWQMALDAAQ